MRIPASPRLKPTFGLTLLLTVCFCCAAMAEQHFRLGFAPDNGRLVEFGAAHGINLIQEASSPLWTAELEHAGKAVVISPADAMEFERACSDPNRAELHWSGFALLPKLEVIATVELKTNSASTLWHIAVKGLDRADIQVVRFPILPSLTAQENESLCVPLWMGQRIENPRKQLFGASAGKRTFAYPGHLSMQCAAISVANGTGIYTASDDTAAYRKDLVFTGSTNNTLGLEWVHYPEHSARAETWCMPYNVVIAPHKGDWFQAAERYRAWATNQAWTKKSRLQRDAIPDWVENTGLWVWNRGRSPLVLEPARRLHEASGLPVSVLWHWWHGCSYDAGFPEYLPPREGAEPFKRAVAAAKAKGVHALVYMNQRLWGMETASWNEKGAERFAVKDKDGKVHPEIYNTFTKSPCATMCMHTPFWRDVYSGMALRAIRDMGVSGIYMDQACTSLSCYDPSHGHHQGGGKYWVEGFQALARDIRISAAALNFPPATFNSALALAGEGTGEAWLPYLDLMLSLQVSKERYAGDDGWETIPFFHAVYHPYCIPFGNYSSLTMPPYDDLWPAATAPAEPMKLLDRKFSRQFLLEQARAFVWGQQPTIANFLPDQIQSRSEEIEYVIRLARVRARALPWLLHGTMLEPPGLKLPGKEIDFSRLSIYAGQQGGLREFQKQTGEVLAAKWVSPEGRVAIALASIAAEPISITIPIPFNSAHPDKARVLRIDADATHELKNFSGALMLQPRDACLLVIKQ